MVVQSRSASRNLFRQLTFSRNHVYLGKMILIDQKVFVGCISVGKLTLYNAFTKQLLIVTQQTTKTVCLVALLIKKTQ